VQCGGCRLCGSAASDHDAAAQAAAGKHGEFIGIAGEVVERSCAAPLHTHKVYGRGLLSH
jgi:hypothetical protein